MDKYEHNCCSTARNPSLQAMLA